MTRPLATLFASLLSLAIVIVPHASASPGEWHFAIDPVPTNGENAQDLPIPAAMVSTVRGGRSNELGIFYWSDARDTELREDTATGYVDLEAYLGIDNVQEVGVGMWGDWDGFTIALRQNTAAVLSANATLMIASFEEGDANIDFAQRLLNANGSNLEHDPATPHTGTAPIRSNLRWLDDRSLIATLISVHEAGGNLFRVCLITKDEQGQWSITEQFENPNPASTTYWGTSLTAIDPRNFLIYSKGWLVHWKDQQHEWPTLHVARRVGDKWGLSEPGTTTPSLGNIWAWGEHILAGETVWLAFESHDEGTAGYGYGYLGYSLTDDGPRLTQVAVPRPIIGDIGWVITESATAANGVLYALAEGSDGSVGILTPTTPAEDGRAPWSVAALLDRPELPSGVLHHQGAIYTVHDSSDWNKRFPTVKLELAFRLESETNKSNDADSP